MKVNDNHYKYTIETKNEDGSIVEFQEIDTIEPIRSVKDVHDELDLENNQHIKRIEEIIFDGKSNEYWYIDSVRSQGDYVVAYIEDMNLMCHPDNHFCDTNRSIFEYGHFSDNAYLDKNFFCTSVESNGMSRIYMKLLKSETSHEQFTNDVIKTYLAEHPVTVWYVLRHEVVIPRSLSKGYVISHEGSTTIDVQPQTMGKVTPVVKAKIGDVSVEMDSVPSMVINNTTEGNQLKDLTFEGVTLVNNANGDNVKGTKEVSHTRYDFAPFYDGSTTINNTVEGGHVSAKLYGDTMINIAKPYGETPLLNTNGGIFETVDLLGENTEGVILADGELTEGRIYGDSLVNILGAGERTLNANGSFVVVQYSKGDSVIKKDIKPSTNYTLITFITSNTLNGEFAVGCDYSDSSRQLLLGKMNIEATKTGVFKLLMTSVSEITESNTIILRQQIPYTITEGSITFKQVLVEGDYTNVDMNYFDGIGSLTNPTIYNSTKNLFDYEAFKTQEPVDNYINIPIKLKKSTTYHIICDYNEWNGSKLYMTLSSAKDGSYVNHINLIDSNQANTYGKSFATSATYDNFVIRAMGTNRDDIISKATKIGIFEGNYYDHEITPHKHTEATFPYTLNKLPNGVADYIDVVNKVHVQRVKEMHFNQLEDGSYLYTDAYKHATSTTERFVLVFNEKKDRCTTNGFSLIVNKLLTPRQSNTLDYSVYLSTGAFIVTLPMSVLSDDSVKSALEYLAQNDVHILYEGNPIYTPLTEEEITQLPLSAYADGYVMLSSDQLTPSMDLRMKASNRYQVDMLETSSYYYLNAPVGNIKLGRENVDITSMPCIIKTGSSLSGDSDYRLGLSNEVRESIIELTFGGYVNNNNGEIVTSPRDAYTPEYLSLEDYGLTTLFSFTSCENVVVNGYGIVFALYSEEKQLIRGYVSETGLVNEAIPAGAKYFKASIRTDNNNNPRAKIVNTHITLAKLPSHRIPTSFTQGMECATNFGYWEGVKEAQIWSLGTYNSSWTLVDNIFSTGLQNAGTLNRLENKDKIYEDEFDYPTGRLIRRVGIKHIKDLSVDDFRIENQLTNTIGMAFKELVSNEYSLYLSSNLPKLSSGWSEDRRGVGGSGSSIPYTTVIRFNKTELKDLTLQAMYDRACELDVVIYYSLITPEISYITDLPKNSIITTNGTTKLLANVKDKGLYLYPQCKPSPLSYPTSLSADTQYTVIHNRKNYDGSVKTPMIDLGGAQVPATGTRTLVTTPSKLAHNELRFIGGENTVKQVMVLHGDWTKEGKTVDYFEGMQSSVIGNKTLENLVKEPVVVLSDSNISYTTIQDIKNKYDGRPKFNSVDIMDTCKSQGLTLKNLFTEEPKKSGSWQYNFTNISGLKQNTTYTLMFDVNQQFNSSITSETSTGFFWGILDGNNSNWNCNKSVEHHSTGVQSLNTRVKAKITTANSSVGTTLRIISNSKDYLETFEITNAILLEGDYTNLDIPYFEGMQSVRMPVLTTTGKNLFDKTKIINNKYQNCNVDSGNFSISTVTNFMISDYIKVSPNTTYTKTNFNMYGAYYDQDKRVIKTTSIASNTFTTPSNAHYIVLNFKKEVDDYENAQLELNTLSTSYEPYKTSTLSTPSDLELHGTGAYRDVIDWKTGSIGRRTVEFSISGDEGYTWAISENTNTLVASVTWSQLGLKDKILPNDTSVPLICDKLPWSSGSEDAVHIRCNGGTPYSGSLMMYLDKTKFSTFTSQAVNDHIKSIGGLTIVAPLVNTEYETVDLVGGGNWDKVVLDGSQDMVYHNTSNGTYLYQTLLTSNCSSLDNDTVNAFSNPYFEPKSANDLWNGSDEGVSVGFNGISGTLQLRIKISTVQELKQYLSENPITVWYQTSTISEQTSNTDPLFFDGGSINLTSGLLPVQSYDSIALPTINRYVIDSLDALKYTVITSQPFYLNGVDYSASSTGLTVIDTLSVTNKELYSDDENITLVQDDGNYYANGVLTQFKGTKEFVKEFIVTSNSTKRTGMKLLEPIELNGMPNGIRDAYNPLTGEIIKYNVVLKYNEAEVGDVKNIGLGARVIGKPTDKKESSTYVLNNLRLSISGDFNNKSLLDNLLYYYQNPSNFIIWSNVLTSTQIDEYLRTNDFTIVYTVQTPDIIKINDMKPYVSTRPENGTIESLDSKLQTEYLKYDNEQSILSPRMLGEGDSVYWEQGSQCYIYSNNKEYIPLESYRDKFGVNLDAMEVNQYVENLEGTNVELGIPFKEKAVYVQTFNRYEDSVIYPTDLENIDETNGVEVDYICGTTWQNPDDLSDIRHLGTLRDDGQYDVTIRRSGDDEIRLFDEATHIALDGDGLNPSEFELTYFSSGGAELGKYGDTIYTLEDTVKDGKLETGMVYGETLVNLMNCPQKAKTLSSSDKYFPILRDGSKNLKTDGFTIVVNLKNNTIKDRVYLEYVYQDSQGSGVAIDKSSTNGVVSVYVAPSQIQDKIITRINIYLLSTETGTVDISDVILLEGNHSNKSIPYFEGVSSTIVNGFTTCGKNILPLSEYVDNYKYYDVDVRRDGDCFIINGTTPDIYDIMFIPIGYEYGQGIILKKDKSYSITCEIVEGSVSGKVSLAYKAMTENNSILWWGANNTLKDVRTPTENVSISWIRLTHGASGKVTFNNFKVRIMIEESTTETPYEPYKGITYTLPSPITLNKVGDVVDTFDVVSGVETRNINPTTLEVLTNPQTIQHTYIPSSVQTTQEPTFILPQPLRSVPNGICDRLYWDNNKGHYCIEKRVYEYTITGANDVGMMDSGIDSMTYAYGGNSVTNKMLNLKDVDARYNPAYSYNNKFGNKMLDVVTRGSTIESIAPYNGRIYYRLLTSRVGATRDSLMSWFNENPTTVYLPLAIPEIIDLPHLNHKLELPSQPNNLPIGYRVEHPMVNPQLGLTIPTKVLNLPKQPVDLDFVMRDNQIGDYILTWSEIKEARQYNIILNDRVIATTKVPEYNTGEEIYGYILVEAQNELGENLSKELYVKTVPNAPAQLTVAHNPMTDSYDFDITFISTSAIADYYTIKYCVDNGDWVVHDIQATDIELDSKVLYQFSVYSIEDNIQVHATTTNDMGTNNILPIATYYMSPTPQWTYRINSKEAFIRWIDESPYDLKYKVRYSYLSEGVYKYAYFEGDTSEIGKLYETALPLAEDDQLTLSICLVSDKENLYCKPVKMSKSLDPNIVPPINFKYRWLARGLIEFSWEDNYDVDVKYEYVLEHKLSDEIEWQSITNEIVSEDVQGKGTVYRIEYQLRDLEQIRVKVRMIWAMNETQWTETLATVFIPVEGNPPTWIRRTQTQEGLLVQWEAQSYVDSYHLYIVDAEGKVLQHIETLDDFVYIDIDYSQPIELHIYEKTRFSGGIESDPTDEMVFTPTMYDVQHRMDIYRPCEESYEMEVSTIQKGSKTPYVIHDVSYTPNTRTSGDLTVSISSPFQISYHPLGVDIHQVESKAYAPLDLSVKTLDTKYEHQFDVMTFERITDKYDMNFNVYTPSVASYPITLEVSKVRIVCLGDSLTSGGKYYQFGNTDNRLVG